MIDSKRIDEIIKENSTWGHALANNEVGVWFKRSEVLKIIQQIILETNSK